MGGIFSIFLKRLAICRLVWIVLLFVPALLLSCEKKMPTVEAVPHPNEDKQDDEQSDKDTVPPQKDDFVVVGDGSGTLIIDGNIDKYTCDTGIKIKGGNYYSIAIRNLTGKSGCPFVITNQGTVNLSGSGRAMFLENLSHVEILGNSNPSQKYGFVFENLNNEAVRLNGTINHFTLSHASFYRVNAYSVINYKPTLKYNGSDESFIKDLHFLNIQSENCGTLIRFEASEGNRDIVGLIRGIEIANVHFSNSPMVGSVVVLEKAEDVNIHHNLVENINSANSNHNGIFYLQGNGSFHDNIVRNHQGNAIRAWVFSIGASPKEMLIYNNIVANSREYGAFELQSFERDVVAGQSTYVNAKVFNNTCGNLKPKGGSFPAQILDLYSLRGGTCEVFNNVGYSFYRVGQNNTNYFWNELSDTKPSKNSNNRYYNSYEEAGIIDDNDFLLKPNSPLKEAAEPFYLLTQDIYGNKRNNKPSIGAVE